VNQSPLAINATEEESLLVRSLQHDHLMTQLDDLGLHRSLSSKGGEEGTEHH